jgi:quercetin dioxygenase-like cupin family protein
MELVRSAEEPTSEYPEADGVYLTHLAAGERISVLGVEMEPGARVPEHSHHHEQLGYVFQGEQTFILADGETVTAGPGDSYALASEEAHAAENRADERLVAIDIFSPPREMPTWARE